jgi:DNA-binding NarL/FixJ family response regulator
MMTGQHDSRPIRVVVVDDHPMLRQGTQALLERTADIQMVGATGEGSAVFRLLQSQRPDVLVLDVHLPDMSGVEVARQVRAEFPEVAVLVLTGYEEAGYIRALVRLGVRGYLGKSASGEDIVGAIRAVAQGRTVLVSEGVRAALRTDAATLTEREQDVLELLVAGRRNQEIAESLSVSLKTVEYHVGHVLEKLGVRSRAEAIRTALDRGLVVRQQEA